MGLPDPRRPRTGQPRTADARHRRADRGRHRGRRRRALAHLVRELRGPVGAADARHPARRHRPQPRAAPPVEGRAARWRLPALELDGARGLHERRRCRRGLEGDACRHPPLVPDHRPGPGEGRLQRHRHRRLEARARRRRRPCARHRPGPAERRLRRPDHPAEGPAVPAPRGGLAARGRPGRALRRRARHTRDPGRGHRTRRGPPDPPQRCRLDRPDARAPGDRARALQRDGVRLPVDLRAARDRQPRGHGLRHPGRRHEDRRHPRGRRRRAHRPHRADRPGHRRHRDADGPGPVRRRPRRDPQRGPRRPRAREAHGARRSAARRERVHLGCHRHEDARRVRPGPRRALRA